MNRGGQRATYVVSSQNTVHELNDADQNEEGHEGVEKERALRRRRGILLPDVLGDVDDGGVGAEGLGAGGEGRRRGWGGGGAFLRHREVVGAPRSIGEVN